MLIPPRSSVRIAGFDTGSTTGWALNAADGILSGHYKLSTGTGARWHELRDIVDWVRAVHGPLAAVYYERSDFKSAVLALMDRGGCYATLEAWAFEYGIPLMPAPTSKVKKALTGDGWADKATMIAGASRLCGRIIANHNEADAIGVVAFGIDHWRLIAGKEKGRPKAAQAQVS